MEPERYDYGTEVRVIRNVRNDGTYPGMEVGDFLVRRGSVGYVVNVGTFLQDQVIYSVHFMNEQRMVGCRAEELIPADAPWAPSRFEFRDKVRSRNALAVKGEVIAASGAEGEILKVVRDNPENVLYHVRFPGHTLLVPEASLLPLEEQDTQEETA
ncbi:nitrogen fixation protein NifZ [Candidatus Methylospira mobilis]|uniref:Nitrogen fixation protein NifZ n=1 Tax=Candidatus Methylospira mobilis TaxID=1808979 RepID=A0A5Q0BDF8_9GAMM|nr:nitrogen fixation protein NifZ [Candidatus Methylospira mobilis]QFY41840.1 nitrogen fixation protein NifZ [Candidatus Methylospira mobilis]WNV06709.1 nitrogen fixation protein NifZ [Candidatus Methylospira mobilis]